MHQTEELRAKLKVQSAAAFLKNPNIWCAAIFGW